MPAKRIDTARLILEPLTADHLDDLVALDSDPEVMRCLTGGRPSSPDEVEAAINLDSERVWAQTMAVNTRSLRVMEKCGLVYACTVHLQWDNPIGGTEHGEVEYQLLREVWITKSETSTITTSQT